MSTAGKRSAEHADAHAVARPALPATPVLVKREPELDWPRAPRLFYVLAHDGLYICRNHEFYRSCVPARRGPSELAGQQPFVEHSFPRVPRRLFELVVGFFDRIWALHDAEASVLLAWDRARERVRLVVPEQTATVVRYSDGYQHPVGLFYYPPADLPPGWVPFGDIHSHVELSAYASATDVEDETYSAGLHVVVGRIHKEPPEVHVEAVVDGARFGLGLDQVVEGYARRRTGVPAAWIGKVKVEASAPAWSRSDASYGGSAGGAYRDGAWRRG